MSSNSNNNNNGSGSGGQHDGLTAQRFEGKPLTQPSYSFRNVPKCSRDLSSSSITYVHRREPFVDSMAEMVLLTKEVMRRQAEAQEAELAASAADAAAAADTNKESRRSSKKKGGAASKKQEMTPPKKRTSKPLSLEYMADRTDVDDPIFGYFVRTDALPEEYVEEVQDANKAEEKQEEEQKKKQQQEKKEETKEEEKATEEKRASRSRKCKKGGGDETSGDSAEGGKKGEQDCGVIKPEAAAAAASSSSSSSSSASSETRSAVDSLQSLPPPSPPESKPAAKSDPEESSTSTSTASTTAIQPYRHRINPHKFQPSMLQGFVAVTTFTNWQTTFRWDSMHDSAFSYDEPQMAQQMASGQRRFDYDGKLAEDMQATVRSGDPWNEGIVWPRIAEISLLGGLGCGKTLINLAIEKLENMAPTGAHNYDFVCLQATENSVPFYEAMGFVRVGAILENDKFEEERRGQQQQKQQQQEVGSPNSVPSLDSESSATSSTVAITTDAALGSGLGLVETTPGVFSSPVNSYIVKKPWERIEEVAKMFSVDVWDIIFLNKEVYEDIMPRSWLKKGTKLFVPSDKARANAISDALRAKEHNGDDKSEAPLWYTARENDTPKMIAKMFDQKVSELIAANRDRLPGLIGTSRLKESTRVKVSRFDLHDDHHVPYCHWTFPDDSFKDSEPSYMMARRLHRGGKKSKAKKSLAVPVQEYLHIEDEKQGVAADAEMEEAEKVELSAPVKPKKPSSAYMIYSTEQRKALKRENPGMSIRELKKLMSAKWKDLPGIDKAKWEDKAKAAKKAYDTEMKQYEKDIKEFRKANPDWDANKAKKKDDGLVNAVVKLTGHEEGDGGFEYYYVLTYIPDLQWCHLAPLRKATTWGPAKGWRSKWVLVDEAEGKEVDVSSTFCVRVKANPSKNSIDADEEEWDIPESKPVPVQERPIPNLQRNPPRMMPGVFPSFQRGMQGMPSGSMPFPPMGPLPPGAMPPYPHRPLAPFINGHPVPPFDHHGQKRKRMPDGACHALPPSSFFSSPPPGQGCSLHQTYQGHDPGSGSHKRRKMTSGPNSAPGLFQQERVLPDGSIMPKIPPTMGANGLYTKPRGRARLNCDWDASRGVWVPQGPTQVMPDQSGLMNPQPSPVWDESATPETVRMEDIPEPGTVCKDAMYYSTFDDETCADVAAKLGCTSRDLALANADRYGSIKADSRFEERTLLRIPAQCAVCGKLGSGSGKSPLITCDGCDTSFHLNCTTEKLTQVPIEDWYCHACLMMREQQQRYLTPAAPTSSHFRVCRSPQDVDHNPPTIPLIVRLPNPFLKSTSSKRNKRDSGSKSGSGSKNGGGSKKAKAKQSEEFTPGYVCKDGVFYCTLDDESCIDVANKLGCNWRNVAIANKPRYGVIKAQDKFEEKTLLLMPKSIDPERIISLSKNPSVQAIQVFEPARTLLAFQPGHTCIDGIYYCTLDDETTDMVASKLGCHWKDLAEANKERYGCIRAQARFEEGTTLIIPPNHDASLVKGLCTTLEPADKPLPAKLAAAAVEASKPAEETTPAEEDNDSDSESEEEIFLSDMEDEADEPIEAIQEDTQEHTALASNAPRKVDALEVAGTPSIEPEPTSELESSAANIDNKNSEVEPETFHPGFVCKDMQFYTTLDNETPRVCATKLGCEWRDLVQANKETYKGLVATSKLEEGTILRIPEKNDFHKLQALYYYQGDDKLDFCCECFVIEKPDGPPMLLCDGCDAACHLTCTHDKLREVPEGDWFCRKCSKKK